MGRRAEESDLRVGLKLIYRGIKRDTPVDMTITGTLPDGRWTIQSDILGIEVEATTEEVLQDEAELVT